MLRSQGTSDRLEDRLEHAFAFAQSSSFHQRLNLPGAFFEPGRVIGRLLIARDLLTKQVFVL